MVSLCGFVLGLLLAGGFLDIAIWGLVGWLLCFGVAAGVGLGVWCGWGLLGLGFMIDLVCMVGGGFWLSGFRFGRADWCGLGWMWCCFSLVFLRGCVGGPWFGVVGVMIRFMGLVGLGFGWVVVFGWLTWFGWRFGCLGWLVV